MKVLFVCTGNSCRSVMAEYLFKKMAQEKGRKNWEALSAGTQAMEGWEATPETVEVLKEAEMDAASHQSRRLTKDMLNDADRIVVMTESHQSWLTGQFGVPAERIKLLRPEGVSDPIGQGLETYRKCRRLIQEGLVKLMEDWTHENGTEKH